MKDDGFIKIYRSSVNSKLYMSEPFTKWQAWCDLIILAQYSDSTMYVRGIRIETKRGCVYMSSDNLAKRWKWSRGKVLRFLSELETVQQIVQQKSNVINCISVTNYDKYQSVGTTNGTTDGTTEQKKETKKNKEEDKENDSSLRSESQKKDSTFKKPTIEEVAAYCKEKGYSIDPEAFWHFYESKGWMVGKNKMKSWKDACVTWVKKQMKTNPTKLYDNNRKDKFKDGFSW